MINIAVINAGKNCFIFQPLIAERLFPIYIFIFFIVIKKIITIGDEKEDNSARVELAHQEKNTCPAIDSDKKKHLSKGIEHALDTYVPKQKK